MSPPPSAPPPPRANPDLLGHAGAEASLRQAWDSGRLAHAWLITGPPGIGKATLAYRFARFVLAGGGSAGDPGLRLDSAHPAFRRVASGGHLDLIALEREVNDKTGKVRGEIVVEQVRLIRERLVRTAAEGGWRVVVIDPADDMNPNAQNALLKVLEEPPPRTLLLLVCHRPGRLLPTVRSRCRRLVLQPLADAVVADLLVRHGPDLSDVERESVVRIAGGSAGRALILATAGGAAVQADVDTLLDALPELDMAAVNRLADQVGKAGAEELFRLATEHLAARLRDLVHTAAGVPVAGAASSSMAARLAGRGGLDRWLELWDKMRSVLARTESANLDRRQVFLTIMLDLRERARRSGDTSRSSA